MLVRALPTLRRLLFSYSPSPLQLTQARQAWFVYNSTNIIINKSLDWLGRYPEYNHSESVTQSRTLNETQSQTELTSLSQSL